MEEKKKKGTWDQTSLQTAITKVLSKELSLREAALCYNIPKSTLHDKTSALNLGKEVTLKPKIGRFTSTFSPEYEQIIVDHVKDLSNRCMPLMKKEFLKLAFDLAESLKIPHRFNKEKGVAGKHFYYDFMERHPDLSLRAPESTSMMRAVGFNKPQVDLFYDNLERLTTLHKFPPSHIYNCDETGVSCVHKHQKVLAPKAVRQVGKLTSAERGKNMDKDAINEPRVNLVSEESTDPPSNLTNYPSTKDTTISNPKPSTSFDPDVIQIVHKLSPLPDAAKKRSAARKRKCERSEILTSSPYKNAAEEKENEKNAKEEKKRMKTNFKKAIEEEKEQTKTAKAKGKNGDKRKPAKEVKSTGKKGEKGKQAKGVNAKGKSGAKAKKKQPLAEASQTEKTSCVVCLEDYDEHWIQCFSCHGWAHEACANIPECSDGYICDRCEMF